MRRGDLLIIVIVAVVALGAWGIIRLLAPHPETAMIVIQVDGEEKYSFPLHQEGRDEIFEIQGVNGITQVHLADGRVRVIESACPDKVCVNTGWSNSPAKPIACLPNRVIVKIVGGGDSDIDLQ